MSRLERHQPRGSGDDLPGSLADPAVRARRTALRGEPHIAPLARYVDGLRARGRGYVPDFDPLDGGIHARLLLLLEKPGPKTSPPRGSGFVSRNTDDPTAKTIHRVMREAGIANRGVVLWNVVPWWNGMIATTGAEKRQGADELPRLLALLPALRGVILAGNPASEFAGPRLAGTSLAVFRSVHPSMQSRNGRSSRAGWLRLPELWREAWRAVA